MAAVGVWAVVVGLVVGFVPVPVAEVPPVPVSCAVDVLACDSDGDGIANVVEEAICGSATCATGDEDVDANGVPDAGELAVVLERGGTGGPVRFPEFGWVRIVLPGPMVIDAPWWPAVLLVAGVVVMAVLVRRRAGATQGESEHGETGRARQSTVGS